MLGSTQITTGKARFSYCSLFRPKASMGGDVEKYSVTLLIPKKDKQTFHKIENAITAAKAKYTEKTGKKAAGLKSCLHNGDGERPNGGEYGSECKDCFVITANSLEKPIIVDADKMPITDPRDLYSGCWGRAIVNFYIYDRKGNKGIAAGLNGVMKLSDGEPLAGGIVAASAWDEDFDGSDEDFDGSDDGDLPF